MSSVDADKVTTKTLSIVDDKGKEVATLTAAEGGAGLWVKGPDGQQAAIFSIKGQTAVGIYDKVDGNTDFMPLALTIQSDVPTVQFRDENGNPAFLTLDEVKKAVDAAAKG